ncbi:nicastrin [Gadus morhua]|uniref:Nicastrin n=1 Tax=Gadus morhua TaxID=8049 RepID=A0A8C5ALS8_GADMO|nr:nicastrin [Gadus morhua]
MDLISTKWIIHLLLCGLFYGVSCNSVEQKIYINLNDTVPCVRLLNATHQIGCQSSLGGDVGVIHFLESEQNLEYVLTTGNNPPYMVILESHLFNRDVMMKLKNGSSRIAGVAVIKPNSNPVGAFSPHTTCPNENTGVYSESYDPALAHCNGTMWNPNGNGLSYEEFSFPIFSLKDDNGTEVIRQCYMDHNRAVNGSVPVYPLCAMELSSHMSAVTDTVTCMRRSDTSGLSLNPEQVCDPLGNYNVWGATKGLNNSASGHSENETVVIAAARLDSRAFFHGISLGADSGTSGFITLLAAAGALANVTREAPPPRTILYAFFQGESFDYIGSSRMVYDMQGDKFPIDLDNIHSLVEIGQVGLHASEGLWVHTDPVSRRNASIETEVKNLTDIFRSVATSLNISLGEPDVSQPLPPASFQRFLRAQPIPGVVLTDHRTSFTNSFFESMYDNAEYLNLTFPAGLTPEEQFNYVTDTAKGLAKVATLAARTLYRQAGGAEERLAGINADELTVAHMLYGFLIQTKNPWFEAIVSPEDLPALRAFPPEHYVGVNFNSNSSTKLVSYVFINLTGTAVNVSRENCSSSGKFEDAADSTDMNSYTWVRGVTPPNATEPAGYCVRSTTRLARAESPAFLLGEFNSSTYSTWSESRWKKINARIFLVAGHDLEMLTLGVGLAVLLVSLLITFFVNAKADFLFSSGREPANATY